VEPHVILIVEDDDNIAGPLRRVLLREGYEVEHVERGEAALERMQDGPVDLVLLDVCMPGMDGIETAMRLREAGSDVPIIMITARADEMDRVIGLDSGADDYLAKPFSLAELLARVRAQLRRVPRRRAGSQGSLHIDLKSRQAFIAGKEVRLSQKEFEVLALLVRGPGLVVPRPRLMDEVWGGTEWFGSAKVLDVTVARLRGKLEKAGAEAQIIAVHGVGFRLDTLASRRNATQVDTA
jgi:DNA-binding response OmpR family regulator